MIMLVKCMSEKIFMLKWQRKNLSYNFLTFHYSFFTA